ncbi:unnamed protein product, partial [Soboliphyme baturini]|uniref:S1 motif domain-containing protein n=1 Tax=Soboliphyme baturini TaxID=241478 RepID=A0A183JAA1_9BILA
SFCWFFIDKFVTANEVKVGVVLRGFVVFARETALVVSLAFNCTGVVPVHLVSSYMIADLVRAFPVGSVVTVKVLTIKMIVGTPNAKTVLSMLESDTGVADQLPVALRGSKRRIIKKEHDDLSYETSDKVFDTWNGKWKGETSLAEIELLPVSEDATERMPVMAASDQNEDIFSQLKQASSFNWQSDRFSMNNLMNVGFEPNAVASSSRDAPAASASNIDEESSSDEGEETKAELNLPASKRNRYEKEKIEEEEILKV